MNIVGHWKDELLKISFWIASPGIGMLSVNWKWTSQPSWRPSELIALLAQLGHLDQGKGTSRGSTTQGSAKDPLIQALYSSTTKNKAINCFFSRAMEIVKWQIIMLWKYYGIKGHKKQMGDMLKRIKIIFKIHALFLTG